MVANAELMNLLEELDKKYGLNAKQAAALIVTANYFTWEEAEQLAKDFRENKTKASEDLNRFFEEIRASDAEQAEKIAEILGLNTGKSAFEEINFAQKEIRDAFSDARAYHLSEGNLLELDALAHVLEFLNNHELLGQLADCHDLIQEYHALQANKNGAEAAITGAEILANPTVGGPSTGLMAQAQQTKKAEIAVEVAPAPKLRRKLTEEEFTQQLLNKVESIMSNRGMRAFIQAYPTVNAMPARVLQPQAEQLSLSLAHLGIILNTVGHLKMTSMRESSSAFDLAESFRRAMSGHGCGLQGPDAAASYLVNAR